MEITQAQIDAFAEITGDDHWIHVDAACVAREQPGGRTVAHGLFLLSLIPRLQRQLFRIQRHGAGLNYGYDKVRFTAPVPVGKQADNLPDPSRPARIRSGDHRQPVGERLSLTFRICASPAAQQELHCHRLALDW